jgi:hypothetical protein
LCDGDFMKSVFGFNISWTIVAENVKFGVETEFECTCKLCWKYILCVKNYKHGDFVNLISVLFESCTSGDFGQI